MAKLRVVRSRTHFKPPRHRGYLVPAVRLLAGRPFDGQPKTNATWRKPGTGHYDPDQAGWWAHQSYRRRAGIVWAVPVGIAASIYGWASGPEASAATESAQREAAWIAIACLVYVVIHRTRRWQPFKAWTEPVHKAIGPDLGVPRKLNPRSYIAVPRDGAHLTDPDRPIVVTLPETFNWPEGTRRAKLAAQVAESGGIGSQFTARFELEMEPRTLTVSCNPQPPMLVAFSEVIPHWEQARDDELVFGLSHDKVPIKRSLATDSPHVLASIGSGGGKTELACALCLQRRWKVGARVIYFDFVKKGSSARWAKGIEGIEVIRHVDVAYQRMIEVYDEIEDRCEDYWHHGRTEHRELFIVLDEANRSIDKLRRYDKLMTADDKHARSSLDAYEGILQVGREADARMVVFGQRASARGTGGGDARDAFGVILASRFRPNTARMLFGDVGDGSRDAMPRSPNHPGRFQVVSGGEAEEAQGVLMVNAKTKSLLTEPERFALKGARTPEIAAPSSGGTVAVAERPGDGDDEVIEGELIDPEPVETRWVDLRTAAELLRGRWPNLTLAALRNYRGKPETRAEFPTPQDLNAVTYLYDLAAIDRFLANRPRRGS